MTDLFSYPVTPGVKSRDDTTLDAAARMGASAPVLRERVLRSLRESGPASADTVAARLNESVLSIRPRFSELRAMGLIEDTMSRIKNGSGRAAIVWRAVAQKTE